MSVFIYSVWLPCYIFNCIIIDDGSLITNVEMTFDHHCRLLILPAGLWFFWIQNLKRKEPVCW